MSMMLRKLLSRVYRNEEDGSGSSEGAPAGGSESSSSDSSVDWEGLNDGVDPGSDDEEEGTPPQSKAPAANADDETPPEDNATPDETPPEDDPEAAAAKQQTPPEDAAPVQPTPEEVAAQQAKLEKDFKEWHASELERLATKVYAFDEETAQRLQTEPELVLPRLAAELEMNATQRALEAVQRMLPQLVPQMVNVQQVEQQADEFFFGKNPDLKKYKAQVLEAGKMFRKMNKNATPEEAAERIGNMVRMSLGLKVVESAKPSQQTAPAKRTPHKPAAAGSGRAAPAKPAADKDMWSDLASDDD